jgi:hypothetical protein
MQWVTVSITGKVVKLTERYDMQPARGSGNGKYGGLI